MEKLLVPPLTLPLPLLLLCISTLRCSSPSKLVQEDSLCSVCYSLTSNCSTNQDCEHCNSSIDCSRGLCIQHTLHTVSGHYGYCKLLGGFLYSNRTDDDKLGAFITLGLCTLFFSIILLICCRVFSSICSWKQCCECQCTVAVRCCCEPKVPALRVIPATGDGHADRFDSTPPPSYLDLYPDISQSITVYPPFDVDPNSETADHGGRSFFTINVASPSNSAHGEDDTSERNSFTSLPEVEIDEPQLRRDINLQAERMFTISSRSSHHRLSARPLTS